MSSKQDWPRWIKVKYYRETDIKIMGYNGCANDARMLFEIFERLNLGMSNIILISSNDKLLDEQEIKGLFDWIEKYRREKENNEKRKETKQKTKGNNQSSGT